MQRALSLVCLGASAAISIVIMVLNASFWSGIGNEDRTRLAFMVGVVALDCMKVTLLPLAAAALDRRLRPFAVTAVGLWLVLTSFSLYSAWSLAQRNSGAGAAELVALTAEMKDKVRELGGAEAELAALPAHRHTNLTAIELQSLQADPKFHLSAQCTQVGASTRSFCAGYRRLAAEREAATLAVGVRERIDQLRAAVLRLDVQANRLKFGNPASGIEQALRWAEGDGWMLVNGFLIGVFEIAAGMGVYLGSRLAMAGAFVIAINPDPPWQPVTRSAEIKSSPVGPVSRPRRGRVGTREDGVGR